MTDKIQTSRNPHKYLSLSVLDLYEMVFPTNSMSFLTIAVVACTVSLIQTKAVSVSDWRVDEEYEPWSSESNI